jgi:hypothetical protein
MPAITSDHHRCWCVLLQVFGPSATNGGGPDAIVLWQLIGAGVSMIVAPAAYSLKVGQWATVCVC